MVYYQDAVYNIDSVTQTKSIMNLSKYCLAFKIVKSHPNIKFKHNTRHFIYLQLTNFNYQLYFIFQNVLLDKHKYFDSLSLR
jgi:hypothetical protein